MSVLSCTPGVVPLLMALMVNEKKKSRMLDDLKGILKESFGARVFETGALVSKVDIIGDVCELTQILPIKQAKNWNREIVKTIWQKYDENINIPFDCCQLLTHSNEILATTQHETVRVSPNNIGSLFIACIFEEANAMCKNNILKYSFVLIKSWLMCESKRFTCEGLQY